MLKKKSIRKKRVLSKVSVPLEDLLVWPNERDIMSRPERLEYVRKLIKPQGCVFCEAHKKGVGFEQLLLFETKLAMVMMNKYPYNNGHLLVLPKRHNGEISSLTHKEFDEVMRLIRFAILNLQEAYTCEGLNMGLNLGSAAGAGIPEHIHFHVIPRWRGDTNFFPLIARTKVVIEGHEQTYDRLSQFFTHDRWKLSELQNLSRVETVQDKKLTRTAKIQKSTAPIESSKTQKSSKSEKRKKSKNLTKNKKG